MAITITVYPYLSPRIIEIDGVTYTDVSIQDLYNAIRAWEDSDANEDDDSLIDAAGKEDLGGGVTVGITATLQNARILFQGNVTPLDDGSGRTCDATDTNGRQLYVDDADFVTAGVEAGDVVFNQTTGEMATITEVVDLNTLNHLALTGQGELGWTSGDNYAVYENIQCTLSGGNLVGVDDVGASLEPILQSPLVQVVRTSSSSATLSELDAIQYSSFDGGVSIDVIGGQAGTAYPIGNKEYPVNNLADAVTIANTRGFTTLYIRNSMTLSNETVSSFKIVGLSHVSTALTIDTSLVCSSSVFEQAIISGVLDGGNEINNAVVGNLSYVNGHIHDSGLQGTITLGGGNDAFLANCRQSTYDLQPTINMGGSGQDFVMTNFSGIINIENLTGANEIGIGLSGGRIVLDSSTVTAGTVHVSGFGKLLSDTGEHIKTGTWNGGVTIINELQENDNIATTQQVYIDSVNGQSGTSYPIGSKGSPVDNLVDAVAIAELYNVKELHITGALTITSGTDLAGYSFHSDRSLGNSVTVTSMTNTGTCYFNDLTVSGAFSGAQRFTTCVLGAITGFDGGAKNCLLTGDITISGTGANYFTECDTYVTDSTHKTITMGANNLNIIKGRGNWELAGYTGSASLAFDFVAGNVKVASTCVSGILVISGLTSLTDESGVGCTVIDGTLTESGITDKVWDEPIADHTTVGSVGEALDNVSAGASPSAIADAVWDEALSGHTIAGSAGEAQSFIRKVIGWLRSLL